MSVLGISSNGEWLHIRLGNGEMGWMSAGLLAKNLDEIVPVYDDASPPPQRLGVHANRAVVNVAAGGNLRAAPDTAFQILRTLPAGTETKLLARSPYSPWVKVQAADAIGWMALFTLTTQSVISSLPIDYQVPLPARATATPSFSFGGGPRLPRPQQRLLAYPSPGPSPKHQGGEVFGDSVGFLAPPSCWGRGLGVGDRGQRCITQKMNW